MKKNVLVFGLIAGLIVSTVMAVSTTFYCSSGNFSGGMLLGYGSMIIAFAFIFIGIKNYRDKYLNGKISFGKGFTVGILIALIASTMYVITWMIELKFFFPDFMEKYSAMAIEQFKNSGASATEVAEKITEMEGMKTMYENPVMKVLFTYMEVLPLGILVTLISAAVLRKKKEKSI